MSSTKQSYQELIEMWAGNSDLSGLKELKMKAESDERLKNSDKKEIIREIDAAMNNGKIDKAEVILPRESSLMVRPEVDIQEAKTAWETFKKFRDFILEDPECFDKIGDKKEMNRTGATRLAVPFGLSIEERMVEESMFNKDPEEIRFKVHVRVKKNERFVDGVGSCRVSEIPNKSARGEEIQFSKREHFAYTKAWTRAVKRAIADMLGGTEAE